MDYQKKYWARYKEQWGKIQLQICFGMMMAKTALRRYGPDGKCYFLSLVYDGWFPFSSALELQLSEPISERTLFFLELYLQHQLPGSFLWTEWTRSYWKMLFSPLNAKGWTKSTERMCVQPNDASDFWTALRSFTPAEGPALLTTFICGTTVPSRPKSQKIPPALSSPEVNYQTDSYHHWFVVIKQTNKHTKQLQWHLDGSIG